MPKSEEGEWIDLMVSVDYDFILVGGHISQCVGRGGMKML